MQHPLCACSLRFLHEARDFPRHRFPVWLAWLDVSEAWIGAGRNDADRDERVFFARRSLRRRAARRLKPSSSPIAQSACTQIIVASGPLSSLDLSSRPGESAPQCPQALARR